MGDGLLTAQTEVAEEETDTAGDGECPAGPAARVDGGEVLGDELLVGHGSQDARGKVD